MSIKYSPDKILQDKEGEKKIDQSELLSLINLVERKVKSTWMDRKYRGTSISIINARS